MRQDVYGVAYEEARSELLDILSKFEQLKLRKERLERAVSVLGPMVGSGGDKPMGPKSTSDPTTSGSGWPTPQNEARAASDQATYTAASDRPTYTFDQVPVPLRSVDETGGDPFQRRVRNAARMQAMNNGQAGLQHAV